MSTSDQPPSSPFESPKDTPEARVRRGCFGVAILIAAITWIFILQTGNLAWSLLLILAVLALLVRQMV